MIRSLTEQSPNSLVDVELVIHAPRLVTGASYPELARIGFYRGSVDYSDSKTGRTLTLQGSFTPEGLPRAIQKLNALLGVKEEA